MPTRRARLTSGDWLLLLASLVGGGMVGYLGLLVGMRLLLEPRIVGESALRLSKQVELVEAVLQTRPPDALPTGVVILALGGFSMFLGFMFIRKIVDIEV